MSNKSPLDVNKMIHKFLMEMPINSKTNLTFALANFIPMTKPDILFHVNYNPVEIISCLNSHNIPLMPDINSLSEDVTVNMDRIYIIKLTNSNLIGNPFPETNSVRIRVNFKTN